MTICFPIREQQQYKNKRHNRCWAGANESRTTKQITEIRLSKINKIGIYGHR